VVHSAADWDGQSQFVGGLYRTEGTYFNSPWNPSNSTTNQVGVASFTPSTQNNYTGTFSYTVNGVGTVTKSVTRLTLTPILLAGNYVGGQSGTYSGCTANASNRDYHDFFTSQVTQNGTSVTIQFAYSSGQNPLTCTLLGHGDPERIDLPHPECPVPMFRRPQHDGVRQRSAGHAARVRRAVHRGDGGPGAARRQGSAARSIDAFPGSESRHDARVRAA
jgi:hypothetical protein